MTQMTTQSSRLNYSPVEILDGGLGTSLEEKYDVKFDSLTTPLWSSHLLVADQDTLQRCQKDFGDAGIDIIETATYQVSIGGFNKTRFGAKWPTGINQHAIGPFLEDALRIAEKAKGAAAKVALSIGPYGACMVPSQEYSGKYDAAHDGVEDLHKWHLERLQLFTEVGGLVARVNLVAFETIPRVDEIIAVRRLWNKTTIRTAMMQGNRVSMPEKEQPRFLTPFWISCLYPGEDERLPDGSPVEVVVETMLSLEHSDVVPWGVGINCTKIAKVPSLVRAYETAVLNMIRDGRAQEWPSLVLYPDGTNGEVYNTETQSWELPEGQKVPEVRIRADMPGKGLIEC